MFHNQSSIQDQLFKCHTKQEITTLKCVISCDVQKNTDRILISEIK